MEGQKERETRMIMLITCAAIIDQQHFDDKKNYNF